MSAELTPFEYAKRKARHGHNDWIVWTDRHGAQHSARKTADVIKQAMLATGTQRHFWLIAASNANGHIIRWRMAVRMFNNARRGFA